ncbi:hypothetical protein GGR50DRAFT_568957 [Xylaria sp. CBS 124048]|nr:hypothetical protein GGR50DRAFT_568957 [Xylaria sp. CBS 124048]
MGIPRFAPAALKYGILTPIAGETVVIDGPGLVHQIFQGVLSRRPVNSGFVCPPSYSILGRMVIGWLEELQRNNVTVRKIYFDGYLPSSKWQVRRDRLSSQCKKMTDLFHLHPLGSIKPPQDAYESITFELSLTQSVKREISSSWHPKPPFLVPAVIDVLRESCQWGPLVEIVPGEADMFCAENIRQHGGLLLTGDSDLLITELGPDGYVSFFTDVIPAASLGVSEGLATRKFSLQAVNDRLGLNGIGGLACIAFDIEKTGTNLAGSLRRASQKKLTDLRDDPEFQTFLEEFSTKEYLPADHPINSILSDLDPRISEIVIQSLLLDIDGQLANEDQDKDSRGPEALSMFLPIMVERHDRKSCWLMSIIVRQLAYGILQSIHVQDPTFVVEYRVLGVRSVKFGTRVGILRPEEVPEQCSLLTNALKYFAERLPSGNMRWIAFAIYQEIAWSKLREQRPLSASLMNHAKAMEEARAATPVHSWDAIHLAAQIQACFYSLRMLKQVLHVAAFVDKLQHPSMPELREQLNTLPDFEEWPTVENLYEVLLRADEANVLSIVAEVLGDSVTDYTAEPLTTGADKGTERIPRVERSNDPKEAKATNRFALLTDAAQG